MEPANRLLKAPQALKKSYNLEIIYTTIENLDKELLDHAKLHQGLEAAIELRLKEAVEQLLGNSPAAEI